MRRSWPYLTVWPTDTIRRSMLAGKMCVCVCMHVCWGLLELQLNESWSEIMRISRINEQKKQAAVSDILTASLLHTRANTQATAVKINYALHVYDHLLHKIQEKHVYFSTLLSKHLPGNCRTSSAHDWITGLDSRLKWVRGEDGAFTSRITYYIESVTVNS